jgi:hypothetical protein
VSDSLVAAGLVACLSGRFGIEKNVYRIAASRESRLIDFYRRYRAAVCRELKLIDFIEGDRKLIPKEELIDAGRKLSV